MARLPSLKPLDRIGILGGGQLGRMLCAAAARLGLETVVLAPEENAPAAQLASRFIRAEYDDLDALGTLAAAVDVVTFEFENVPAEALRHLAALRPVLPDPEVLAVTQDRLSEKMLVESAGIGVAPWRRVDSPRDIADALAAFGEVIVKTRRFGYDGKGQWRLRREDEIPGIWTALAGRPAIAERVVAFEAEISVVLARTANGMIRSFPPSRNDHRGGILRRTEVPCGCDEEVIARARAIAERLATRLSFVGTMAVEMFVLPAGAEIDGERVLVNEIAPRVHNSGHWTIEGAVTSQFEQHIRAIAGWPLGATDALGRVVMENLIGAEIDRFEELLGEPDAHIHHYGKREVRPGRKMGHVTWVRPL
ncbi:MAG: N5-carboxyaminoimidazole ribonucleotide synthase [Rhodothalassiaceae bacterium]|nr:MAG: N5-carboxyaminoimidazole ribonucleotide synthase [Rhodothalassiaceae bacterium]